MQNTIDDVVGFTHCHTGVIHGRNHDLSVRNDFQELYIVGKSLILVLHEPDIVRRQSTPPSPVG